MNVSAVLPLSVLCECLLCCVCCCVALCVVYVRVRVCACASVRLCVSVLCLRAPSLWCGHERPDAHVVEVRLAGVGAERNEAPLQRVDGRLLQRTRRDVVGEQSGQGAAGAVIVVVRLA